MTNKLYYSNPYLKNWKTTIKQAIEKDSFYLVTLEETAFYPEGGGQPADMGTINGIEVLDVLEENNEVFHKLASLPSTKHVECEINWERRFDHMQQHSGQHLLSAVCVELYDAHTVSFHLGAESVTIDLAVPTLTDEQLFQIEQKVNQYIYQNLEIHTYFVSKDQLDDLPIRKIPLVTENIRIVQMGEIDYNACCGTHVDKIGELGLLKLIKIEKQKGNTRLYFKTGMRALYDYEKAHHVISALSNMYSCHRDNIIDKATKMEEENKQYIKEIESLKNEILSFKAAALVKEHSQIVIVDIFDQYSIKDLQTLAGHVFNFNNQLILILASRLENRLLLTHAGEQPLHCGEAMKIALKELDAKGGGNDKQAQASYQDESTLNLLIQKLTKLIENN